LQESPFIVTPCEKKGEGLTPQVRRTAIESDEGEKVTGERHKNKSSRRRGHSSLAGREGEKRSHTTNREDSPDVVRAKQIMGVTLEEGRRRDALTSFFSSREMSSEEKGMNNENYMKKRGGGKTAKQKRPREGGKGISLEGRKKGILQQKPGEESSQQSKTCKYGTRAIKVKEKECRVTGWQGSSDTP